MKWPFTDGFCLATLRFENDYNASIQLNKQFHVQNSTHSRFELPPFRFLSLPLIFDTRWNVNYTRHWIKWLEIAMWCASVELRKLDFSYSNFHFQTSNKCERRERREQNCGGKMWKLSRDSIQFKCWKQICKLLKWKFYEFQI